MTKYSIDKKFIDLLEVGKGYKYKELVELLGWEFKKSTNSRNSQLKELERYCKLHKEGHKIIIDEIYSEVKEKEDGRTGNPKNYNGFLVSKKHWHSIGVYKIVLNNYIYIGSTTASFRDRFLRHVNPSGHISATRNMLKNGATFEIIQICEGLNESAIRQLENMYIKLYKKDDEWNLVNKKQAWSVAQPKYKIIKFKVLECEYAETLNKLKKLGFIKEG